MKEEDIQTKEDIITYIKENYNVGDLICHANEEKNWFGYIKDMKLNTDFFGEYVFIKVKNAYSLDNKTIPEECNFLIYQEKFGFAEIIHKKVINEIDI